MFQVLATSRNLNYKLQQSLAFETITQMCVYPDQPNIHQLFPDLSDLISHLAITFYSILYYIYLCE